MNVLYVLYVLNICMPPRQVGRTRAAAAPWPLRRRWLAGLCIPAALQPLSTCTLRACTLCQHQDRHLLQVQVCVGHRPGWRLGVVPGRCLLPPPPPLLLLLPVIALLPPLWPPLLLPPRWCTCCGCRSCRPHYPSRCCNRCCSPFRAHRAAPCAVIPAARAAALPASCKR